MNRIFIIDWLLLISALLIGGSGVFLHLAGHGDSHAVWHNWAVAHIVASVLFLVFGIWHIKQHWAWYRSLWKDMRSKKMSTAKSPLTVLLSVLFIILSTTGILLLWISGSNSHEGLWHYVIGLLAIVVSAIHIIKRFPLLRKSLKKKS